MTRIEATERILAAKKQKGLTFEAIARAVGRHKLWVTSALLGQATLSAEEAEKAVAVLGLGAEVAQALQDIPSKGSIGQAVPVGRARGPAHLPLPRDHPRSSAVPGPRHTFIPM